MGKRTQLHQNIRNGFKKMKGNVWLYIIAIGLFLTGGISCTNSFEPFQDNDKFNFTVFGFLDASADTQWVRIAPAREQFESLNFIPEMTITLQQVDNSESVLMNKTLVPFQQGFNAVNAWSDIDIKPDYTYRLTAEADDGKSSSVTITIPSDFPTPILAKIQRPTLEPEFLLLIEDVEHLVDVQSRWYTRVSTSDWSEDRLFSFSNKQNARSVGTNRYTVSLDPDEERERIFRESLVASIPDGKIEILHHQVFVASGGPEWDDRIPTMDDVTYALPESISNVENGLGYMVGVFSKTIPFKNCIDDREVPIACEEEDPFW